MQISTVRLYHIYFELKIKRSILFIKYFLGIIIAAYRDFEDRFSIVEEKQSALEMVHKATDYKIGKFTKQDIREYFPSLSVNAIEGVLRKLVAPGDMKR